MTQGNTVSHDSWYWGLRGPAPARARGTRRRDARMPPEEPARARAGTTVEGEGDDEGYPGVPGATKAEVDAFLSALDDYQPVIPDELTNEYLKRAGVDKPDTRVTRLISLATERFVRSIADDAYRCAVQRNQAQIKEKREMGYDVRDKRIVLENEDLAAALKDYNVNLHKPAYYVGAVPAEEADGDAVETEANGAGAKRSKRK